MQPEEVDVVVLGAGKTDVLGKMQLGAWRRATDVENVQVFRALLQPSSTSKSTRNVA